MDTARNEPGGTSGNRRRLCRDRPGPHRRAGPGPVLLAAVIAAVLAIAAGLTSLAARGPGEAPGALRPRTAPAPAALTTADASAWLDGLVPALIDAGKVTGGVSVAIVRDGRTIAARGYGSATASHLTRDGTRLDPREHLVRIGSISKTFTGVAVLQLAEQGKLDLDADVRQYLDFRLDLPLGAVTLRHLLSHTAGFEDRFGNLISASEQDLRPLRDTVAAGPPRQIYAPGTLPAYSNYGNDLAGYIVQRVSGISFEDYLDRYVLAPLQMTSSTARQPVPARLSARLAAGFAPGSTEPGGFEFLSARAAGAISSTAADMAAYMNALLGHAGPGGERALPPWVRRQIVQAQPVPGTGTLAEMDYVSLSFRHSRGHGTPLLGHAGDTGQFHSLMVLAPEKGSGIFVSVTGSSGTDVRTQIGDAFVHRYLAPVPPWPPRPAGSPARAAAVAGDWTPARRSESTFARSLALATTAEAGEDGDLRLSGQTWREIRPWVWENEQGTSWLTARHDADGAVTAITTNGYSASTRSGPLNSSWQPRVIALALAVLLISALISAIRGIIRWRRRRTGAPAAPGPAPPRLPVAASGLRGKPGAAAAAVTPWVSVTFLAAAACYALLFLPLAATGMAVNLPVPALRAGQVLLAVSGAGLPAVAVHAAGRFRARRWASGLGWSLVLLAGITVLTLAAGAGLLQLDASY